MQLGERLEYIIKKRGISNYKIAKDLGISQSTIKNWITGNSNPTLDKFIELLQLIEVSADYLLFGDENNKEEKINEEDKRIQKIYSKLNITNKTKVDGYAEGLLIEQQSQEGLKQSS